MPQQGGLSKMIVERRIQNVLSLFDGISSGQLALKRAGLLYDNYYASEINKNALRITMHSFPDTIQLGDVRKVYAKDLPKIDLLLAGSPCQGFSRSGQQLGFNDSRSALFFEFVRLLKECAPKYFLLENVPMRQEYREIISDHLKVPSIMINSALVSAQNRRRFYWTNIPNITQPEDKGILLKDIIEEIPEKFYRYIDTSRFYSYVEKKNYVQYDLSGKGHNSQDQRAFYLHGKHGSLTTARGQSKTKILTADGRIRETTLHEVERLQTVPDGYTELIGENRAKRLLGNGWTIDVISHIFKFI